MSSTYLQRTANNNYYLKATFSFWFKRSGLGEMGLFGRKGSNSTANLSTCHFGSSDDLLLNFRDSGGTSQYYQITNRKFRDTNAWYHFHYIIDGGNSTQGDRSRLYINGVRETSFALNNNPSSSTYEIATFLSSDGAFTVGRALRSQTNTFGNFNGSIGPFHCSTGYVYEPTVFGETDATTGEWKINPSPTFTPGTDGFTILKDGNTITDQSAGSNNFSLGGGTLTSTKDCPSNVFTTLNPLDNYYPAMTLSSGNTRALTIAGKYTYIPTTLGMTSGKYYAEIKCTAQSGSQNEFMVGITSTSTLATTYELGHYVNDYGYNGVAGNYRTNNENNSYGSSFTTGDIIGIAVDLDNNKLYFSKNGVFQNSGVPTSGSTGTGAISITDPTLTSRGAYFFALCYYSSSIIGTFDANFGNGFFGTSAVADNSTATASTPGTFNYDVPTGYQPLSTKGLNA